MILTKDIVREKITKSCLERKIGISDKKDVFCKSCLKKLLEVREFFDGEKIWQIEPDNMKIICGADPQTGESWEKKYILCLCLWENFKDSLLKIRPGGNLFELESPRYEEGKGFFLTIRIATNRCFNDKLRWQFNREDFQKVMVLLENYKTKRVS